MGKLISNHKAFAYIVDVESNLNSLPKYVAIKLSDGTMIEAVECIVDMTCNTTWGSIYETDPNVSIGRYPVAFAETPVAVFANVGSYAGILSMLSSRNTRTITPTAEVVRGTAADTSFTIDVIAVGRWK